LRREKDVLSSAFISSYVGSSSTIISCASFSSGTIVSSTSRAGSCIQLSVLNSIAAFLIMMLLTLLGITVLASLGKKRLATHNQTISKIQKKEVHKIVLKIFMI
jgi:hypothetical protein